MNIDNKDMPEIWLSNWMDAIKDKYGADVYDNVYIDSADISPDNICRIIGTMEFIGANICNINCTCNAIGESEDPISISKSYDLSKSVSVAIENHSDTSKDLGITADLGIAGDMLSFGMGGSYSVTTSVGSSIGNTSDNTISQSISVDYDVTGEDPVYEVNLNVSSALSGGVAHYLYKANSLKLSGSSASKVDINSIIKTVGGLNYSAKIVLTQQIQSVVVISCQDSTQLLKLCCDKLGLPYVDQSKEYL